jgi:hypothetical protein
MKKSTEMQQKADELRRREDEELMTKFDARRRAMEATRDTVAESFTIMLESLEANQATMIEDLKAMGHSLKHTFQEEIQRTAEDSDLLKGHITKTNPISEITKLTAISETVPLKKGDLK